MDRFDQDYVEKKTLNSRTPFALLGRESQPPKPSAIVVGTAHDAISLQAILIYKGQCGMRRTKVTARILESRKHLFSYAQCIHLIHLYSSCQCHILLQYVWAVLVNLHP